MTLSNYCDVDALKTQFDCRFYVEADAWELIPLVLTVGAVLFVLMLVRAIVKSE